MARETGTPAYAETLSVHGITIPVVDGIINDRMRGVMEAKRYEAGEVKLLRSILRDSDRILELGAGVGLVSAVAAQKVPPSHVVAIEANPELIPVIHETHRLNDTEGTHVIHGVGVTRKPEGSQKFYINEDFWGSTFTPPPPDHKKTFTTTEVPEIDLNQVIREHKPDIISMDIEGGEIDILSGLNTRWCRNVIVELHPKIYGNEGVQQIFEIMHDKGFVYDTDNSRTGSVVVFKRTQRQRTRQPKITAITCMKNEAPFILEWVAYHRAIGVTDFLVFTNDCNDGTDLLLDRLDAMGIVRHVPNYSTVVDSPRHQPLALAYARYHKEVRDADWIISMDVDEFINVKTGDGHLSDLFAKVPEANLISITHLDFGCGGHEEFLDVPIIEQMTDCDHVHPKARARRGVKTLINIANMPNFRLSNHRPHLKTEAIDHVNWVNGAGRAVSGEFVLGEAKGLQARRTYRYVQLNHYPVRSMESYLVKSDRGNVVAIDSYVGLDYWHKRNKNVQSNDSILRHVPGMKAELDVLMRDAELAELQRGVVKIHRAQIEALKQRDDMSKLLDAIRKDHFDTLEAQETEASEDDEDTRSGTDG